MNRCSYANKPGYLLETPVDPRVLVSEDGTSDKPRGADNQQERSREERKVIDEATLAADRTNSLREILRDYTPGRLARG